MTPHSMIGSYVLKMFEKKAPSIRERDRPEKGLSLEEEDLEEDPFILFSRWFSAALGAHPEKANALVLSTVEGLQPTARTVLLKDYGKEGFTFYTNYESDKARQLEQNPRACLLFYWESIGKQIRIEGSVKKLARKDSETYFSTRSRESQIGAHASRQSQRLSSRKELEQSYEYLKKEFQDSAVPCPEHWGGYCLSPNSIEFWQGRSHRLHDRILYRRKKEGGWERIRLAP